jgi:outer membrane usher protein
MRILVAGAWRLVAFMMFAVVVPALPVTSPPLPATNATSATVPIRGPEAKPAMPAGAGRAIHIVIGFKDGKRYIGDVMAAIAADGSVALDSAQVLLLLKGILNASRYAAVSDAAAGRKEISLTDLSNAGVNARYDASQLQVIAEIAPGDRPRQDLSIAALDQTLIGELAKPERFSAYLNLRGSVDYVERGATTGIRQPQILMDGATRLFGPVLEGEALFSPDELTNKLSRQGTRLVYDETSSLTRWTLGDLRLQTDGFQGSREMAGLSVFRRYDQLAPQLNARPRGNRSFTLAQASTVQTMVNGQPVQQVRLEPGTYNAANFPFVEGANDVNLIITSDAGTVENVRFSLFFDRSLLGGGLSEFGAFAGFASDISNSTITYDHPKPLFSGFFRHGFDDTLTAGANFQADGKVQLAGFTGLWGSPFGTLGLDLAGSHDRYVGDGYAINASFSRLFQDTGSLQSQNLSLTFQMRSRNFSIVTSSDNISTVSATATLAANLYRYETVLSYSRSFGEYTYLQLDGRYARAFAGGEDIGSIRASLGYGFSQTFNANVNLQYSSGGFQNGVTAGIQLTYRFDDRSNIRAEYQSQLNMRRLSYQNSQGRGTGAWSVSGDLEDVPSSLAFSGSADYAANRADLGVGQTVSYDMHGSSVTDMRSTMRMGTSLAITGNGAGIGRPIFDSFSLFKKHPSLGDAEVTVDPGIDGEQSRTDLLGPAVLSDLASNSLRTVTYDAPEAPAGYDIGAGSLRVVPSYKSGYTVQVGSDYSMTVWGRLLDSRGVPISLLAGRAVELAPDGRTVTLFTSRDGRFSAQGMRQGMWRIEMPSDPPANYTITVTKSPTTSVVDLGSLRPTSEDPK